MGYYSMRWYILRTLLHKELLRHLANRGGITLALLLVVAAMLYSFFGKEDSPAGTLVGGVQHCYLDYWEDGPWIDHLRRNIPKNLQEQILFRPVGEAATVGDTIVYPPGTGAIQLRPDGHDATGPRYKVWFWHPGKDRAGLAPFEAWFWKETHEYLRRTAAANLNRLGPEAQSAWQLPQIEDEHSALQGGLDGRSLMVTALVFFAVFFVCVYLLSSLTCEERERGVLLSQALSPASLGEILAAKFLFYPPVALALAGLLAGILEPAVLARPFFWLALSVAVFGSLGIGLTIASVARTQRAASMGALCYMLVVSLLVFTCQQTGIRGLPNLALEYHCPRILQAAVANAVLWYHWLHLAAAAGLAIGWGTLATLLFRRQGWQ